MFPFGKKKSTEKLEVSAQDIDIADIIAPSMIELKQNYLKLGERLCKSFFVFSYPRYLTTGWLSPIINVNFPLDISMHIHPVESGLILKKLRKKVTEVQAEIEEREEKGLIRDPSLQTAYEDIENLRDELQTARERVFRLGLYLTIYGDSEKEMRETETFLRSIFEARLIYVKPALMREKQGFISCLPYGLDELMVGTPMNTAPLSSVFPFVSPDLSANEGILYGINLHNNSLVLFDRFSLENANMTIFSKAGGGKSLCKNESVLIKDKKGKVKLTKIGGLVEEIIEKKGIDFTDEELEGKKFPGFSVWTFNENMKGEWGEVKIAARKKAPETFYKFKTKSGREITTTGDHNLVALQNGQINLLKGEDVKVGDFIPLPRNIAVDSVSKKQPLILKGTQVDSPEFLRLAGFITAEGTVLEKKVLISNTEKEVLDVIENDLNFLKIKFSKMKDKLNNERGVYVGIGSFTDVVKKMGGLAKSGEKRVWPFVFGLNKEQIRHYLSAYFEGDGGVEGSREITATSKSKELISDISFLLYYFGIVCRIKEVKKEPTNCNWKEKKTYWRLVISGQDNVKKFAKNINFVSQRKQQALAGIIFKNENTNVDIIPGVQGIFQEVYNLFGFQLHNVDYFSDLKRGVRNPSQNQLKKIIFKIEQRIDDFKKQETNYRILAELPSLANIIDLGQNNKDLNKKLWLLLGHSWQTVRSAGVKPGIVNAFKMINLVQQKNFQPQEVKQVIYAGFQEMDLQITRLNPCLQGALAGGLHQDTSYEKIQTAGSFVWQKYQDILINVIPQVEEKLKQLKALANADLFWDPIASVQKINNKKEEYVYDLTCENSVFLAGNAGMFVHNSYFAKLEIMRYLMQGVDVIVLDPENEYEHLNNAVGGSYFKISLNSPNQLNPFDLPDPREDEDPNDVLRSNVINLVGLLRVMLGGLSSQEDSIIDRAITETYAARDITPTTNPSTWKEKIPLMSDFESVLAGMEGTESLIDRLGKFTRGSYAQFFNSKTNIDMTSGFTVFAIRDMEDELRPMAMFMILRFIWNKIRSTLKKRILLVDEAWWLMQTEDGASFLYGLCKRARKYWLGVTTITQDVSDFMKSDYGKPIVSNSSLQFLLKQSPAAIDTVQQTFALTDGEKNALLQCDIGEGIFIAGQKRVALKAVASYAEDQIITSSPDEIVKIREAKKKLELENQQ